MFKAIIVVAILIISGCTTKPEIFKGNVQTTNWGRSDVEGSYNRIHISLKECDVENFTLDETITLFQIDTLGDTLNISEYTIFRFNYNATQDTVLFQLNENLFQQVNRFQITGYSSGNH